MAESPMSSSPSVSGFHRRPACAGSGPWRRRAISRAIAGCWILSGEVDFILKCVASDMATFQEFVTHLTAAPHVRNVRTSLVLHNSKYEAAVPLEVKGRG